MSKQYYKSAQCFVDQYDNYTLDGTSSGPRVKVIIYFIHDGIIAINIYQEFYNQT